MTAFLIDLRYAIRSMRKAPGFSVASVLTLALGMTLCTTAMVVFKAYLLHDLPYPAADRLFSVRYGAPGQSQPQDLERLDWASLSDAVEHPVAWDLDVFYMLGGEHAESIPGAWVTPGFVEALGIRPAFGRGLDARAFAQGGTNEALISHRLWTSRFAGDPAIVGRTFTAYVSDRPAEAERFTIAGVLPAGFWHINPYTDILAPLRAPTYPYMVRVKPGVTPEYAASRITRLVAAGARNVPANWRAELLSTHAGYVQTVRPVLRAVTIASALVLLVACGNVAGLLLIRATRRNREVAVRTALGAGRLAIARMLLAEGLVIGATATFAAVWATVLTLRSLGPLVQRQLGRPAPAGSGAFALDAETLLFAAAIGLATAVLCTLAPLATSFRSLQSVLQSGVRTATEGRRSQRTRTALIAVEIAVSLALLVGATLMLRSVGHLLQVDVGFSADRVINASITLRQNRYPDAAARLAIFDRMRDRLSEVPGTESLAFTSTWPVQQPRILSLQNPGSPGLPPARAAVHGVSPRYFDTLSIRLTAGRDFTNRDRIGADPVAIVSETLARRLWPDGNAIGNRIAVPQEQEAGRPLEVSRTIVGVVGDVRQGPADVDLADLYLPILQPPGRFAFALMRTSGGDAPAIAALRSAFRDIDPEISVFRAGPLQARVDELTTGPRFVASLLSAFAAIAALLALVGVYGVIAYAVRQREREIALRMALGADPAQLIGLFVRQGSWILLVGLGLGLAGALAGGRLVESQLFGVTSRDPLALTGAVAVFAVAGLAAIWWPSRRAARTDPAIALRLE